MIATVCEVAVTFNLLSRVFICGESEEEDDGDGELFVTAAFSPSHRISLRKEQTQSHEVPQRNSCRRIRAWNGYVSRYCSQSPLCADGPSFMPASASIFGSSPDLEAVGRFEDSNPMSVVYNGVCVARLQLPALALVLKSCSASFSANYSKPIRSSSSS